VPFFNHKNFQAMKNSFKILLMVGLIAFVASSCKKDPVEPTKSEFELMTEYMVQNDLDLPDILDGWVTTGAGLNVDLTDFSVPDYYVMDLRNATDFDLGHIKDAHNVALPNILEEAENANGKPILMVCYTGQTAGRAVGFLRLMGYEAKSLKWGMSSWHADFTEKWDNNATDVVSPNWLDSGDPPVNQEFSYPTLNTDATDGASILEARVRAALTEDWTISKTDVLDNPSNYFVNNKWPLASWEEYGHINGAFRIDEELTLSGLDALDPDKVMITYCYTGQTSAITTAWLDALGYNGRSLMFGANGIVYSKLLVGVAGSAPKKSWKGEGSGSEMNFGYYDSEDNLHFPN
jgi:rhodanese-related sulfurtransferase